jgi:15,16-dihydrobiliverdin:ferredoxin oxidoreductase
MDAGEGEHFAVNIPRIESISIPTLIRQQPRHVLDKSQASIGMPWTESIVPSQELTFMSFWDHQIDVMKSQLTNLQPLPVTNKASTRDFSLAECENSKVRVGNLSFSSSQFRKIRMTYYDAGPQAQVFNSLWYPSPEYNLPVLGIDLIQFHGGKKHLAVMDFQPIQDSEEEGENHACKYEYLLAPIRDQYPSLHGKMSARFYDETQFFSSTMLFARFDNKSDCNNDKSASAILSKEVWPAFQQYLDTYLSLVHGTNPSDQNREAEQVLERQRAYDIYSADRDPALHMFKAKFGDSWADEYVHEFLFDLSR